MPAATKPLEANLEMQCQTRFLAAVVLALTLGAIAGCGKDTGPGDDGGGGDDDKRIVWTYDLAPEVYYGSPALNADESTVYFGTSVGLLQAPQTNHSLVALNTADGSLRWKFTLKSGQVRSAPAIAQDGSIYLMIEGRNPTADSLAADALCHLSSSGRLLWSFDVNPTRVTSEVGLSSPAIGEDGSVYVGGDRLYAIRPDGTMKWTAFEPTYEARLNSPVIGRDGTVYFVFHNIPLTALDPQTGQVLWSCPLGVNDHCFSSPAIAEDGTVYAATQPGVVYAVSATGQIVWQFDIASVGFTGFVRSSPAIDADGTIYFGLNSGNPSSALFALNSDGSVKWIFEPGDQPPDTPLDHFDIYSSPAIGSDGTVYFGQEFGYVYAVDSANGALKWFQRVQSGITWPSPAIAADGKLFIADLSGRCYAIATDSRGLKTAAPWPKYRHDSGNSARAR